jgi:transposase-like protein
MRVPSAGEAKGTAMKKKAYSPEQIVKLLRGVDAALAAGKTVEEACRELGGATSSYHRWRNQYGGMATDEVKRLEELEKENERLERIVADLTLDEPILKEAARGN